MVSVTDALLIANLVLVGTMEGSIFYLVYRYLRGFLGHLDSEQLRILAWKLDRLTTLSEAEKEQWREEHEVGPTLG